MINKILVGATVKAFEDILTEKGVPFEIRDDEETRYYKKFWEEAEGKELALRQAVPAIERIASKEPFLFEKGGEPLCIRLNYINRELERDSFGEILLERTDIDWRFAVSVKSNAKIIATMPVADREFDRYMDQTTNKFNEIDDFGSRIFGIPCSNEYFNDVNEILLRIEPHDDESWAELVKDEDFIYGNIITPMLSAIGREMPRICKDHPEAPQKLIDYFYGNIDYYFINPIEEVGATRIGAINSHGDLGRMPHNKNLKTPEVKFPTDLLDVRSANGRYGELSKDTLQLFFNGGWSVCITINPVYTRLGELGFDLKVYLPITPFGSYRDQVDWAPEK